MANEDRSIPKQHDSPGMIIQVEHLAYCYPRQDQPVLSDLTLHVANGSFTAVVGRSGCGKTTLLNLIAGYLRPSSGYCRFEGQEIACPAPSRIPIFQVDALLPWSRVEDNVMLFAQLRQKGKPSAEDRVRAASLLQEVELDPSIVRGKYPKSLSEGMKKRVEIARALFAQPQVILADEPFANLDVDTQESLHQLVERIWRNDNLTFLFTTHNLHEALYLASEVVVLKPHTPSTIVGRFPNPFQGQMAARREKPEAYYKVFDQIRAAMKGECVHG